MQTNFLENMQIHKYKPGDVLVRHISREHLDQLCPQVSVELRLNVESGGGHSWILVVKITRLITCSYMWRLEQCHQGRGSTGPVPVLITSKWEIQILWIWKSRVFWRFWKSMPPCGTPQWRPRLGQSWGARTTGPAGSYNNVSHTQNISVV